MNGKPMKKSPNTDEVSLRSAKESTRGGKIVQPRENDTKLIPCGSWKGLDNGQPWQEYSENAAENHLDREHRVKWEIPDKNAEPAQAVAMIPK